MYCHIHHCHYRHCHCVPKDSKEKGGALTQDELLTYTQEMKDELKDYTVDLKDQIFSYIDIGLNPVEIANTFASLKEQDTYVLRTLTNKIDELNNTTNLSMFNLRSRVTDLEGQSATFISGLADNTLALIDRTERIEELENNTQVVDSVAALSTIQNPKTGLRVYVKSYLAGRGYGGGYFTYDKSKASINDGGVVINGWVRDMSGRNSLDVKDFGAIESIYADSYHAIQAALDYAKSVNGGEITITGQYGISETLKIRGRVSLNGPTVGKIGRPWYSKTIIKKLTPGTIIKNDLSESTDDSAYWGLRNIMFDGDGKADIGVDIEGAVFCIIDNVLVRGINDIGFNISSRKSSIAYNKFTDMSCDRGAYGVVIDIVYDSSIKNFINGNLFGFSGVSGQSSVSIDYRSGGSNYLESYGGQVTAASGGTSLRVQRGYVQLIGEWWCETPNGKDIEVTGGTLVIVGNGRFLGKLEESGGTIIYDQPMGIHQIPVMPSLTRRGIKHAFSFRDGNMTDCVNGIEAITTGVVEEYDGDSRFGSAVINRSGNGSLIRIKSTEVDWTKDWTIAVCVKQSTSDEASSGVGFIIKKNATNYLGFQSSSRWYLSTISALNGVEQAKEPLIIGNYVNLDFQWIFIKYDSEEKRVYTSRGIEGMGDSVWNGDFYTDLSEIFTDGTAEIEFGRAFQYKEAIFDEILIVQRHLSFKEVMSINNSAVDLEAMLGSYNPPKINESGPSSSRPDDAPEGFQYFDTDLVKPIYWTGTDWVDSSGTTI